MLWEASGDCEDSAILYVSLAEAMGLDAVFARGLVNKAVMRTGVDMHGLW